MKTQQALLVVTAVFIGIAGAVVVAATPGCSQQPPGCQVSPFLPYAAKYVETTAPDAACSVSGMKGDQVGMAPYSPANKGNTAPDLSKVTLAMRTLRVGSLVAHAAENDVVDATPGDTPDALGPFASAFPDANDLCKAKLEPAHVALDAVPFDLGDPQDPDDDVKAQPAVDITEAWSDVQVFVTAAAEGTEVQGHYKITDNASGCSAEYDALALFPAVGCEDDVPDGDPVDIASIAESATPNADGALPLEVNTVTPHGLQPGDLVSIADVDDENGVDTFDGVYTVATATATSFTTVEIDPFNTDPDPAVTATGTVQKLVPTANANLCSPVALPDKGVPVGSGISPDVPTKCEDVGTASKHAFLCLLDADPKTAKLPVFNKKK